ncbi:hypothetical protein J2Z79_001743 [Symbiobacterium terraclitae]|uniref:NERD domain-containing protein n=1 Tax=Symbiobacterium terraclitae TaxID=557451 RepID=A0ABS4JS35_9FIRM|nr:DUF2161 family putative PD-(D/E)XK-type phosphodiesterase [Symbiobacterium terraclitae]MBP2018335.1 hypothetical protein [Symbiobacterium terraclitae]
MQARRETDLYGPVKALLEGMGFTVKGEVNGCDLVAVRGEDLVIVELKRTFTLDLVLQGVERLRLSEAVYLAVEEPGRSGSSRRWSQVKALCRRLGVGLITVRFRGTGPSATVLLDPEPVRPRAARKRRIALLREFHARSGDRNTGGSTRRPLVTAYREDALRLAAFLQRRGPAPLRAIRSETGVQRAGAILQDDHYRWFERVSRGVYRLSPAGEAALQTYADVVNALAESAAAQQGLPGPGGGAEPPCP